MDVERFWVLGGHYTSTRLHTVRDGELQAHGPFETRDLAQREWKRLSQEHSPMAGMKFSICAETVR
ncbi:MAG: hypothetical protein INR64_07390, partial [Caulobacteraceae bacterium]|nr:hypothetical protein [Caulobacter sp.]